MLPTSTYNIKDSMTKFLSGTESMEISNKFSILEQIEDTCFDFSIKKRPIYSSQNARLKEIPNKQEIYNSKTGTGLSIVGDRWQPHQPKESFNSFQKFCSTNDLNVSHIGLFNNGEQVFAIAEYPDEIKIGEDVTAVRVILSNSNKLGLATTVKLFTYRLVCQNGLSVANSSRLKNLSHVTTTHDLSSNLDILHQDFEQHKQRLESLTNVEMTKEHAIALLIDQFGDPQKSREEQPKSINQILALFNGQAKGSEYLHTYNTAYGLLQATTEYLNHRTRRTNTHTCSIIAGSKNNQAQSMLRQLVSLT